ncbi:MAG: hypothetical protein H7199_11035 [Burkholderiales bacterium]|nr:hypothetical protein [Flavobacterium sp.]
MKKIILLLLVVSNSIHSQIKITEFDAALKLLQGNDQEKAINNLESLEKKFPNDVQVIFLRGFYQFRDGNQNGAMMSFSNAIKTNPKYAMAYGGRASLFASKGLLDKAIVDLSEAIKLEPKNISFLNSRSSYYYDNHQYKEGLEDMKTKIKLMPNDIMGYFDAAVFAKSMDNNYNSDDFFNQAYATRGIPKYVTDALFGKFLIKYGRFDEAKIKFEEALALGEKDFDADDFNNASIAYNKTKNYDKAIICAYKAIAKQPDNIDLYFNLTSSYIGLNDWEKVKDTAQLVLNINSEHPMANMFMAAGLMNTGNENKALEYEAKAKRLDAEQNK